VWYTLSSTDPKSRETARQVEVLSEEALRLLLKVSATVYLSWLTLSTFLAPPDDVLRPWVTLPLAAFCIVGTWLVLKAVWTMGRILVTAVEWSLHSYEQALRNTQQAQAHRGQLVQALRQLDTAYYQVQQANVALEVAWKAVELAERSKSEFVTNLSHELRTPLILIMFPTADHPGLCPQWSEGMKLAYSGI